MVSRGLRRVGEFVVYPVLGLARWIQRKATGDRAILELEIDAFDSAHDAQVRFRQLRMAARDPRIVGVWLRLKKAPGGWATTSDLRQVIADIRAAGKPVRCWMDTPGNALMWVASACDHVSMPEGGELYALGVAMELTMLGAALERVGIEPDLEAAGEYKSFGETFTRRSATPQNREAVQALADGLQRTLEHDIALGRGLSSEAVADALAMAPLGADEALAAGWVDAVAYEDEARDAFEAALGEGVSWCAYTGWAGRSRVIAWLERVGKSDRVAVLHLEGSIVMEDTSGRAAVRAPEVTAQLQELQEDDRIKAVVLHVVSPGGSALASDLIWREVMRLKDAKPVIASFGDVSASGGYYLAAGATKIFARATSLTGSIGVVGGKVVLGGALRRLGIAVQTVSAAPHATMLSSSQRFSPSQRRRFRASLQRVYDGFVRRVAEGRGRAVEEVEPVCRGRVWTGEEALKCGLVDEIGDLEQAVKTACDLVGLPLSARYDLSPSGPAVWLTALRAVFLPRLQAHVQLPLGLGSSPQARAVQDAAALLSAHPSQALAWWPVVLTDIEP